MTYTHVNHDGARRLLPFTAMDPAERMADRINRLMEAKGLNQSQVSRLLRVARMTVSQWCAGTSEPRPGNLIALAELLCDGDVHYLVFGAEREPTGGFPPLPRAGSSGSSPMRRRRRNV